MNKLYISLIILFPLYGNEVKKDTTNNPASIAKPAPVKKHVIRKKDFVDSVAVIIYTDKPIILAKSDIKPLSINGAPQRMKDVVLSRIMDYEAQEVYKIPVADSSVKKYIESLKDHHSISDSDLKTMFKRAGYTYDQGLDEFRRMLTIDSLLGFKIKSRLVVPEKEIRQYYDKHPEIIPARYEIKKGFLSKDILSKSQRDELKRTGKYSHKVQWLEPYWLQEDHLAESRKFITTMKVGEIADPIVVENGFQIIKLISSKPSMKKTYEESYKEIFDKLREPLFEKMLKAYQEELLKKYKIVYL